MGLPRSGEEEVPSLRLTVLMAPTVVTAVPSQSPARPAPAVVTAGALAALCCVGFAAVNIVFEATGRFSDGPYADYASGLSVANWVVTGLKGLGAAAALLSLTARPRLLPPRALGVMLWGAFATLAVYALGSVVQAIAMVSGLAGDADEITLAGIAYVSFFLLLAVAFGVLAISHSRRFGLGRRTVVLGALGAPVLLGVLLMGIPAVLVAVGVMPSH
jgi:hypothetical protein